MKRFFLPLLAVALFSCNNDDDNNGPGGNNPNPPLTGKFISFTADGAQVTMQENETFAYNLSNGGSFGEICTYEYGGGLSNFSNSAAHPQGSVSFDNIYISAECDGEDVFPDFFQLGTYSYGNGNNQGVIIYYTPAGSGSYGTEGGSQAGSTFTVTELTPVEYTDIFGTNITLEVKGTFSCTLYSIDNPASTISVENGSFSIELDHF